MAEHSGSPLHSAKDVEEEHPYVNEDEEKSFSPQPPALAGKPAPANNKISYTLLAAAVIVSLLSLILNIVIVIQLNRGTSEMKVEIERTAAETRAINNKVSKPCPSDGMISNKGTCFFALFDDARGASEGERACNKLDSRLADIDSQITYEQLVLHLQKQVEERGLTTRYFQLGMTFAPDRQTVYFRNGMRAWFKTWATGYNNRLPYTSSSYSTYTQVVLRIYVEESVTSNENGFVNQPPDYDHYPLCQRDV